MKVIIGADLVPTQRNDDLFRKGDVNALLGSGLSELLGSVEYRIFNLETPITDEKAPIKKRGSHLCTGSGTITGIKKMKVDLFTVANNHIMDQGEIGFNSTLSLLDENEIAYVGGGSNLDEAAKPYIIEIEGVKTGIYACTEHEFSVAQRNKCGANPYDPLFSYDHVSDLKRKCNHVIVLYHGGKEGYRYPSPELQRRCRRFIDKGADVVVCQHSHCIGCMEEYKDGTIVYGQGNFLFNKENMREYWRTSLLLKLDIDERINIDYIPLCVKENKVRMAENDEREEILQAFFERSSEIKDSILLEKRYSKFAESKFNSYVHSIYGTSVLFRVMNKLCGKRLRARISEKKKMALLNFINCEAHRELLLKGLELN